MKFRKIDMPAKGESNGGGLFVKFKDGENKIGVLRGEIYEFRQKWENGKSLVVGPDDREGKLRFRANFVTKEDGELKVKILEFGVMLYSQLAEIADGYEMEKTAIRIKRTGTGTDTVYTAIPVPPKEQPNAAALKTIEALSLNMLEHKHQQKEVKNHAPQHTADDSEIPF